MSYPKVLGEFETLELALQGYSIARAGDGELNHLRGKKNVSQVADPKLTAELQALFLQPPKGLIPCIPTMDPRCPKIANWKKYEPLFERYLSPKVRYGSAFISRPDNAPWIDVPEFYDKMERLWKGLHVTLVANGERSFTKEFLESTGAVSVHWVRCSYRDAYAAIDRLEEECRAAGRRTIICAGPAAKPLAARLCRAKIHAIDLGHAGMFHRRYANPKIKNRPEQREINRETGKVEPNE